MQNHPWYVQQLSQYTWNRTSGIADSETVRAALTELINTNTPFYQSQSESLSTTQLNLLKAIANSEEKLTSTKVMSRYKLGTPRNVSKNRDILIKNDIMQRKGSGFEFLDPAFELWFRQYYLSFPIA